MSLETKDSLNSSVDLSFLQKLRDMGGPGGAEIVQKVVKIFLLNSPVILHSIEASLKKQDHEQVGRLAHKLKSSAGNIGALKLIRLLDRLEHCDETVSNENRQRFSDEIQAEYKKAETELLKCVV